MNYKEKMKEDAINNAKKVLSEFSLDNLDESNKNIILNMLAHNDMKTFTEEDKRVFIGSKGEIITKIAMYTQNYLILSQLLHIKENNMTQNQELIKQNETIINQNQQIIEQNNKVIELLEKLNNK